MNDVMRVTAEKMAAGGRCIARVGGKAVFVQGILPGETAEIEVTVRKKDYDEAKLKELLVPSTWRTEPACPAALECGGCTLMIAKSEFQAELKRQVLLDLLKRFHCGYGGAIEHIGSKPFEYRSRFQFHKDGGGNIGFCARGSGKVIPVGDCPVAVPEIRRLLANGGLRRMAREAPGKRFNVFSYGGKTVAESRGSNIFSLDFCKKRIEFDIRSFFQSNIPAFEKAADAVFEALAAEQPEAGGGAFLDFYAGSGVFSLCASSLFRRLYLIEENAASVASARANLANARLRDAHIFMQRDSGWVKTQCAKGEFDAAVFDPPRGGIGRQAIKWLFAAKIRRLAYLSCSAPAFARDSALLVSNGWILHRIVLCDFYPQTHHIEVLGFFSKRKEWMAA